MELNAFIGAARVTAESLPEVAALAVILKRVQHELFNLGSILATLPEDVHPEDSRASPTPRSIGSNAKSTKPMPCSLHCDLSCCRARAGSMPSFTLAAPSAAAPNDCWWDWRAPKVYPKRRFVISIA